MVSGNFNFNKYLFFELNDGIGRLVNFLIDQENNIEDKPNFYFIHHMSPHYPYVTDKDCSYKFYSGKKNFEGYKSAYLCNLKKIKLKQNFQQPIRVSIQKDSNPGCTAFGSCLIKDIENKLIDGPRKI